MQMFTVDGAMTTTPGAPKHEFSCQVSAENVELALEKFKEVYDPEWYQVRKIASIEMPSGYGVNYY